MERQKFEDSFQEAFQHAEVSPSEKVWSNIELSLERNTTSKMRQRLLIFKWVAAACFAFAMAVGGVGYYQLSQRSIENTHLASTDESLQEVDGQSKKDKMIASKELPQQQTPIHGEKEENREVAENNNEKAQEGNHLQNKKEQLAVLPNNLNNLNKNKEGVEENETFSHARQTNAKEQAVASNKHNFENHNSNTQQTIEADPSVNTLYKSDRKEQQVASLPSSKEIKEVTTITSDNAMADNSTYENMSLNDLTDQVNTKENSKDINSIAVLYSEELLADREEAILKGKPVKTSLATTDPVELSIPTNQLNEGELLLLSLQSYEKEMAAEKRHDVKRESFWASVGFAAGAFNNITYGDANASTPVFNSVTNIQADALLSYTNKRASNGSGNSSVNSGQAYSIGMNLGGRVSERWVVQGGLNYITRLSSYASDAIVTVDNQRYEAAAYLANNTDFSNAKAVTLDKASFGYTDEFTVNNTMELISFPVQAGYIIVNKKLNVLVNGGIATDLFIKNKVVSSGSQVSEVVSNPGSDSPYRSINFNGLVGTEVSYQFASRYRMSVNPGIRYPLNSIYKDDTNLKASPVTFDVGLRFVYIFK